LSAATRDTCIENEENVNFVAKGWREKSGLRRKLKANILVIMKK
jgi:hypothetical protein